MTPTTRRQFVGIAVGVALVAAAALLLSPAGVLRRLAAMRASPLFFAAGLAGLYLLRPAVAWPISALSLVVGFVYGPVGYPLALAGAVVTTLPPYLLARRVGASGPIARLGESGGRFFAATGDFRGVVGARLAPLPTDPVSYGAGLSGVALLPYVCGTAAGEAPWVGAAVVAGASMGTLTVRGASTASLPLVVGGAALAALVLAGPAYRHLVGGDTPQ
ncbi:MAG: TVP38/TMEM64 family protein [Haloarculaceae archaeon]